MNQVGHHSIIDKFTKDKGITDKQVILKEASDYTDNFLNYIYYNYNYEICRSNESNVIEIKRAKDDIIDIFADVEADTSSSIFIIQHLKDFFAVVNERKESTTIDEFLGNQDDNVSFLHAMGAVGEEDSINIFKRHLERCFSEYLFLKDENKALFMLGIAFHGIMDSFTPSHTDFQKYAEQNMAFHAQGDVIPIYGVDKKLIFDPGQVSHDLASRGEKAVGIAIKGFDGDDILNPTEKIMLLLYLYLGNIRDNVTKEVLTFDKISSLVQDTLSNKNISEINTYIQIYYEYGCDAYLFSESALSVLSAIWDTLSVYRKEITTYEKYNSEETLKKVSNAVDIWGDKYNSFIKKLSENYKLAIIKALFSHDSSKWQLLQGIGGLSYSMYKKTTELLTQTMTIANDTVSGTLKDMGDYFKNTANRLL